MQQDTVELPEAQSTTTRKGGRRKSTATETIYARVTPAIADKIRDLAAAENVSLGVIVTRMAALYPAP